MKYQISSFVILLTIIVLMANIISVIRKDNNSSKIKLSKEQIEAEDNFDRIDSIVIGEDSIYYYRGDEKVDAISIEDRVDVDSYIK